MRSQFRALLPSLGALALATYLVPVSAGEPSLLPAPPSDLTLSEVTAERVDLSFSDNSNNETGFILEWQVLGGSGGFIEVGSARANRPVIADTSPITSRVQLYRVRSVNRVGVSAPSNVVQVSVPQSNLSDGIASVFPAEVRFPRTRLDKKRKSTFSVRNRGTGNLTVRATSLTPQFTVTPVGARVNARLLPGRARQFAVEFRPTAAGPISGFLQVVTDDPDLPLINVTVSGSGKLPPEEDE